MAYRFDAEKIVQIAGFMFDLLDRRRINLMALLKMLYIADRESIRENGEPITGDRYVAMKHGPVLSGTYDLMKSQPDFPFNTADDTLWLSHFERLGHDIVLRKRPGTDRLTKYERRKLEEISREYADADRFDLSDFTHEFEEWIRNDPGDSSCPIDLRDVLDAVGRSDDARSIGRLREETGYYDRFFRGEIA